jgi:hypothetical protein
MEGTMYIDAPAFNIIRSSGKPGEIKVRVLSPGLASAEVVVNAAGAPRDPSTAIVESRLPEGRRRPVAREGGAVTRGETAPAEMKSVSEDLAWKGVTLEEYARQIDQFLRQRNAGLDFDGPEYRAVVRTLNPWVNRRVIRSAGETVDGVRQKTTETIRYEVAEGRPILVPGMKYLGAHAAKGRSRE